MSNHHIAGRLFVFSLFCLIMITKVKTQQQSIMKNHHDYDYKMMKHSDHHSKSYNRSTSTYNQKVFVQVDATHYYQAKISTTQQSDISIQILDQSLTYTTLIFNQPNQLVFVDAYQNVILLKQVTPLGKILAAWVLIIDYNTTTCKFSLKSFSLSAQVDNQLFNFAAVGGVGKYILEYNQQQGWIAILGQSIDSYAVYKINLKYQINVFIFVSWLKKAGVDIEGGNSRVIYNRNADQLLFDTRKCPAVLGDPTPFVHQPICSLTKLPLYKKGKIINLAGWYFQYLNPSQNNKAVTTFKYEGYGDIPIQGQASLLSSNKIKYLYDDYNFFVAITNCDIYLTNVYWDEVSVGYKSFSGLLSDVIKSKSNKKQILQDWSNIRQIVFIDNNFYFLSQNKFFVYGIIPTYFTKLYQINCIHTKNNSTFTLFQEINKYMIKIHH